MEWYYAKDNRPCGPVSAEELERLERSGDILSETLIWNESMTEWQPRQKVSLPWDSVSTSEDVDDEGSNASDAIPVDAPLVYADMLPRAAAKMTDMVILLALLLAALGITDTPLFDGPIPETFEPGESTPQVRREVTVYILILQALYQISFLTLYQATPGKLLFGMRIVFADGRRMNLLWAVSRFLSELIAGFTWLTFVVGCSVAFFNPERRALHDFICGSRVVTVREPPGRSRLPSSG